MNLIDKHIIIRTTRAIKCLYLNSNFYNEVKLYGLSAETIFHEKELYISDTNLKIKNKESIENSFLWLIKIGVLRREVDGQGLTSKVRLTPLGRSILEKTPDLANQYPSISESIRNWISRKLLMT